MGQVLENMAKQTKNNSLNNTKVVVWGTNKRVAMYYHWLNSNYNIVAFVSESRERFNYEGVPVIGAEDLEKYSFDQIIVSTEDEEFERAYDVIGDLDRAFLQKTVNINQVACGNENIESYLHYMSRRQLSIIDEILKSRDDEISDYRWMYDHVIQYGVFCFQDDWMLEPEDTFWTVYGLQQIPEEFAAFCVFLSKLSFDTAVEIGVYRGRSAFFLCAVMARKNENLKYKMVDLKDRIDDYDMFKKKLPQLEKVIPSNSEELKGENYDFVFIDADHSYDASILDYNNVGQYANRITAFHDIYDHGYDNRNGGIVRTWREVLTRTPNNNHVTFSKYPDEWMGIGAVEW